MWILGVHFVLLSSAVLVINFAEGANIRRRYKQNRRISSEEYFSSSSESWEDNRNKRDENSNFPTILEEVLDADSEISEAQRRQREYSWFDKLQQHAWGTGFGAAWNGLKIGYGLTSAVVDLGAVVAESAYNIGNQAVKSVQQAVNPIVDSANDVGEHVVEHLGEVAGVADDALSALTGGALAGAPPPTPSPLQQLINKIDAKLSDDPATTEASSWPAGWGPEPGSLPSKNNAPPSQKSPPGWGPAPASKNGVPPGAQQQNPYPGGYPKGPPGFGPPPGYNYSPQGNQQNPPPNFARGIPPTRPGGKPMVPPPPPVPPQNGGSDEGGGGGAMDMMGSLLAGVMGGGGGDSSGGKESDSGASSMASTLLSSVSSKAPGMLMSLFGRK